MAIEYYSDDDDLLKLRPNILQLGVTDWEDQHIEAFGIINRKLIADWYRQVAAEHDVEWRQVEFDPELIDADQINRLSCYKTLQLIYLHLMKDGPDEDGFERLSDRFLKLYNTELNELLAIGINYDWDSNDTISYEEKYQPSQRRLLRA